MVQKELKKARGRPRAYEPETAMQRATEAFWKAGYSATSLDALSEATGMNRPSLYAAFGDKRALYRATLDRYARDGLAALEQALDAARPLREGLKRAYSAALATYFPADATPRGCYLIGTAATESVMDVDVREQLRAALAAFDAAFEARFRLAIERHELPATADPRALARIASAVLHSLALRSRAGDSRATLRATAAAGIEVLCGESPSR